MEFPQKLGTSTEANLEHSYTLLPQQLPWILVPQQLKKTTVIFAQNQSQLEVVDHMKSRQDSCTCLFQGCASGNISGGSVWCCFANNCLHTERLGAYQEMRKPYWFDLLHYLCILKGEGTIGFKGLGSDGSLLLMCCLDSVLDTEQYFTKEKNSVCIFLFACIQHPYFHEKFLWILWSETHLTCSLQ